MLNILGLGHAFPETNIDNGVLTALDPGFVPSNLGITGRGTSAPLARLQDDGNRDLWRTHLESGPKTTDLAHAAALLALQRAGLEAHQLGLILGDTSTPLQTTPAEAQRLGKRLDLKVTAYDVTASSTAMLLHAHIVRAWKSDRIPDYLLSVSSNTPTQSIDYRSGIARELFGDGAATAIFSAQRPGKLSVLRSAYSTATRFNQQLVVEKYRHLKVEPNVLADMIVPRTREVISLAQKEGLPRDTLRVVPPQYGPTVDTLVASALDLPAVHVWSNAGCRGNHFGSSEFSCLSERWDTLRSGEDILLISAGGGGAAGYLLLHVN